jgi:adenylosuccinate synthase
MNAKVEYKPIIIVSGAQYGSESKGSVSAALCERRSVKYAVRTGTVNAGHTVYLNGRRYVMQQLPTGWVSPHTTELVIGPGAYVYPEIFFHECDMVREAGFRGNIWVDNRAGLHLPSHTELAQASGSHHRIGATGKGCSHAIISRIRRDHESMLFKEWCGTDHPEILFTDTAELLNQAYDEGSQILLEGTQGTLLDLYLGPYPYTTHKQCTASQWVTEAGLSPSLDYEVVLVARTYPIRVAGNSGPMPQEIDWPTLTHEINAKLRESGRDLLVAPEAVRDFQVAKNNFPPARYADVYAWLSESNRDAWNQTNEAARTELAKLWEFTTVTKKLRRVARLDTDSLKYSVMVNRPKWLALTFLNYEFPELWGSTADGTEYGKGVPEYIMEIEKATGVGVGAVTTGPESQHFHDFGG